MAKCGWIGKKIGRHPQYTIIFDICSVFLKILIFVALTRDFRVGRVRPAADLRATSCPWEPPHKLFSRFFFHDDSSKLKILKVTKIKWKRRAHSHIFYGHIVQLFALQMRKMPKKQFFLKIFSNLKNF